MEVIRTRQMYLFISVFIFVMLNFVFAITLPQKCKNMYLFINLLCYFNMDFSLFRAVVVIQTKIILN